MSDPNYDPPTRAEMRTIVSRTLRDPGGEVFGPDILNDIIIEGLADLSGYRPIEAMENVTYDPQSGNGIVITPALLRSIWQVEFRNNADTTAVWQAVVIPYEGRETNLRYGWDHYAGIVHIGRALWAQMYEWRNMVGAPLTIFLSGYRDRAFPDADGDVLDLQDGTDYLCLVKSSRMLGFQLLSNDRALYQQWLAATNNTDVSPTQLQGMLNLAEGDYDRQRRRSSILRRIPTVGPQYP